MSTPIYQTSLGPDDDTGAGVNMDVTSNGTTNRFPELRAKLPNAVREMLVAMANAGEIDVDAATSMPFLSNAFDTPDGSWTAVVRRNGMNHSFAMRPRARTTTFSSWTRGDQIVRDDPETVRRERDMRDIMEVTSWLSR